MIWFTLDCIYVNLQDRYSLNVNLLAQRPGQVDSDKWKFSNAKKKMNLFCCLYVQHTRKWGAVIEIDVGLDGDFLNEKLRP
jgi:hypothetical protein